MLGCSLGFSCPERWTDGQRHGWLLTENRNSIIAHRQRQRQRDACASNSGLRPLTGTEHPRSHFVYTRRRQQIHSRSVSQSRLILSAAFTPIKRVISRHIVSSCLTVLTASTSPTVYPFYPWIPVEKRPCPPCPALAPSLLSLLSITSIEQRDSPRRTAPTPAHSRSPHACRFSKHLESLNIERSPFSTLPTPQNNIFRVSAYDQSFLFQ